MAEKEMKSIDQSTIEMIEKAAQDKARVLFERTNTICDCPISAEDICCNICAMGPCRVPFTQDSEESPGEKKKRTGVCGATIETIATRNFCRRIAAGTAAHSDHGRQVNEAFLLFAKGMAPGFSIKDEQKLLQLALELGVNIDKRNNNEIAIEIGQRLEEELGKQKGELIFLKRAPRKRQELWRKLDVAPRGIDREVVEMMHRTNMGVDQNYESLLLQGTRTALADGWGSSMIATELQDIMFGTPAPVLSQIDLGVLKDDEVNIIIHGDEPYLAEILSVIAQSPELVKYTKSKGAKGINLTAISGNFLQQELAIVTGAVEAMVVGVQCIMQGLVEVAQCYHTRIITTDQKATIRGATFIQFDEHNAPEIAKNIIKMAIDNFPNRGKNIYIPKQKTDMITGFSHETISYILGGSFRASYRLLNDNIISGRIRGIAAVLGCNNARVIHDNAHVRMIKELIKNDVLVLQTGCGAMASAKAGLMVPEAAKEYAGPGLASVCEVVGIPPVLNMGTCIDNSRILSMLTAMVRDGGLGEDISNLPVAGSVPEWVSEKAIAIGQYFVASGVYTVFGTTWPNPGSKELTNYIFRDYEKVYGGMWAFEAAPLKAARLMINHIDKKRKALGIDKTRERVLFDMAMRQKLETV